VQLQVIPLDCLIIRLVFCIYLKTQLIDICDIFRNSSVLLLLLRMRIDSCASWMLLCIAGWMALWEASSAEAVRRHIWEERQLCWWRSSAGRWWTNSKSAVLRSHWTVSLTFSIFWFKNIRPLLVENTCTSAIILKMLEVTVWSACFNM